MTPSIAPARTARDIATVAALFRAYAAELPVDLGYQAFDTELASLPGKYAPPAGALLLALSDDGAALGCVALRPMPLKGACEMKRLYVTRAGRGLGLGRALMLAIVQAAKTARYNTLFLDTLPSMAAAQQLYRDAGFVPTDAYYDTPIDGTVFMRLTLDG